MGWSNQLKKKLNFKFLNLILTLDISNNSLSGPLPLIFGAPMLTQLVLSINKINGTIPSYICELKYLEVLDLSDNFLVGKLPRCSNGSEAKQELNMSPDSTQMQLSALILYNNDLSGKFPEFLQHCQELTLLHLPHNKFVGELPIWIAEKLPRLSYLQLRYNLFSGSIPVQLTKLENLRYLDLAYNRISGSIPPTLGGLKAMIQGNSTKYTNPLVWNYYRPRNPNDFNDGYYVKYHNSLLVVVKGQELYYTSTLVYMVGLDFSCNNLGGDIPEEITSLVGLKNLNFSHNHLTGNIPEKIGLLRYVESLDLSFNMISGEIPSSLSDMASLSYLNLSFNNLSGRIPSGNQLQTLGDPDFIYIGNYYLCGPPLSRNCSGPEVTTGLLEGHSTEKTYFHLGLAVGFVMGLWLVFIGLLFLKTCRFRYFQLSDKLQDSIQTSVWKTSAEWFHKSQRIQNKKGQGQASVSEGT
ncbi:HcrVf1 protein-like [Oryza sativa Japonica Group]|uniref:non-specific serine/threonine protein kinase n=3 Tax=Oryza sativa subsp. japonica TaxID=39947 RepID=Q5ZD91_ORYSJ|nr:hypothetical protein EE612_003926 [Oryza sativa]BAD52654.1 HcrVf1 protein-like [Oryza sativa Japonica Group]BAD53122.1 HcrVf1 protein-like [Oryza sativa Japonica Group]BAS73047.1 Os01g0603500 [Oryza sativa Japonica Group]